MLDAVRQDLRYALRQLRAHPGFTAMVLLTLALGIGANTAMFSFVRGIVLRPLPYPEPDRLVTVWEDRTARDGPEREWTGRSVFSAWRGGGTSTVASMAAINGWAPDLTGTGRPETLAGARVSPGYFRVLGVRPALGRTFRDEEEAPGSGRVAVLSHGLWTARFGADPGIVGRTIRLDDEAYTVVGVMPAGFHGPIASDAGIWSPLTIDPARPDFGNVYLRVVARLRPGVEPEAAREDLRRAMSGVSKAHPDDYGDVSVSVASLHDTVVGGSQTPLFITFAAVGLILLIACANVANLLLARLTERRRELAVRSALGASRGRLVGQMLTESVVLGLGGGLLGLPVAWWTMRLLRSLAPAGTPRLDAVRMDPVVLSFGLGAALLTALLFGLLPARAAWRGSATAVLPRVRGGREAGSPALRSGLVVGQLALGVVVLAAGGLLLRSFLSLRSVDPGFRTHGVVTATLGLPESRYPERSDLVTFTRELRRRLDADPASSDAGITSTLPLTYVLDATFVPEGMAVRPGRAPVAQVRRVTPGYFQAMGTRLAAGRGVRDGDVEGSGRVVVVNRTLADRYFPGGNAVGRRLHFGGPGDDSPWWTVVGVIEDMKERDLDTAEPMAYLPFAQAPSRGLAVAVAARGPVPQAAAAIRRAVAALDPEVPVSQVRTTAELVRGPLAVPRFEAVLLGGFSALALLLAVVGAYGVMAYAVTRRRKEFGIRLALGAGPSDVVGEVLGHALRLAAAGSILGLAGALLSGRFLRGLLHGIGHADPLTLAGVTLVVATAVVAAAWVPARRATRVDPAATLRDE